LKVLRLALLDRFGPLRTYNRREANSLTMFDDAVLSAIQDRNRAYSSYRSSRSPENWDRFRSLRNRAKQVIITAKRSFAGRFLDLSGAARKLWRNIRSFGLMIGGSDNIAFAFSADELNIYFTSPAAGTDSPRLNSLTYSPLIEGDSFSFSCIGEVCVAAALGKITSNVTGLDGIPLVFIKLLLTLILPVLLQHSLLFGKFLALYLFPKFIPLKRSLTIALFLFYLSLQRLLKMLCTSKW
jgi:hypothetical protein